MPADEENCRKEGRSLCLPRREEWRPGSGKLFSHIARGMWSVNPKSIGNSSELCELIPKYVTEEESAIEKTYCKNTATLFTKQ